MSDPLIFKSKLNNSKIIMYGEDHKNIDNSYYESISKSFKINDLILVEHSTNACEIKPEEERLFREHAKGSEWIFYTQKKLNNPNVICFDTRAEEGYLTAFQEQRLITLGDKLPMCTPPEIREYIDSAMKMIQTFNSNSKKFQTTLPGYFEDSFEILESQLNVIMHLLRLRKKQGAEFPEVLLQVLSGVGYTLALNLRRVSSVSVDIDLSNMISHLTSNIPKNSNVYVFCGRNHVVRTSLLLGLPLDNFTREQILDAKLELDGDLESDAKLLKL